MQRLMWWIVMAGCILTACSTGTPDGEMPTLAQIPQTTLDAAVVEITSARATLPPSFTPTFTLSPTATITPSPTVTISPSATITETPTATATNLPTLDPAERPQLGLALLLRNATAVAPATNTPFLDPAAPVGIATEGFQASACPSQPVGGFGQIFSTNPDIAAQLGCPAGNAADVPFVPAAWQNYQQGLMVWLDGEIFAFYSDTDVFQRFADTFQEGVDPETTVETPPDSLVAPIRGFLKIWSSNDTVRSGLGWALAPEQGVTARAQLFPNGRMVWLPGRNDILVLVGAGDVGNWRSFAGQF